MNEKIFTLIFDFNRCYLIRGKQTIMIDGGSPGKRKSFLKQLRKLGVEPGDIKLIVLTHGDFDHIGSVKDFKEITGAQVVIHRNDLANLEEGRFHWPPGVTRWGKISRFLLKPVLKMVYSIPELKPDIVLNDTDFPLKEFGIDGKIIYTPGHTPGSVSVVLDSGEAFAGCMAQNSLPFTLRPHLPIYATDMEQLKKSWKTLLQNGAKVIYPGHGKPFLVNDMNLL
jgi:hydroxyacylglutathione hydrolase